MNNGRKLYYANSSYNPQGSPFLKFTDNILGGVYFYKTEQEAQWLYNVIKHRYENFNKEKGVPYYDIVIGESDIDTLRIEKITITIDSQNTKTQKNRISKRTDVKYEATALVDHIDKYGNKVVNKGEKSILKKPNLDVYKETGKAYFQQRKFGYNGQYLIPVKLVKVTKTTIITEETTETRVEL